MQITLAQTWPWYSAAAIKRLSARGKLASVNAQRVACACGQEPSQSRAVPAKVWITYDDCRATPLLGPFFICVLFFQPCSRAEFLCIKLYLIDWDLPGRHSLVEILLYIFRSLRKVNRFLDFFFFFKKEKCHTEYAQSSANMNKLLVFLIN